MRGPAQNLHRLNMRWSAFFANHPLRSQLLPEDRCAAPMANLLKTFRGRYRQVSRTFAKCRPAFAETPRGFVADARQTHKGDRLSHWRLII